MFTLAREFLEALILALIVFFLLQVSVQNFRVEGSSMEPTLHSGEYIAVNKIAYWNLNMAKLSKLVPFWDASTEEDVRPFQKDGPDRGSIIVFKFPQDQTRNFIKRVIGLPGERVSIRRGVTFINGRQIDEPYITHANRGETRDFPPLEPDEYFVIGDNRTASNDSRHWGPITIEHIIGNKLIAYDLPVDIGFVKHTQ